jgi:hypothetical protein
VKWSEANELTIEEVQFRCVRCIWVNQQKALTYFLKWNSFSTRAASVQFINNSFKFIELIQNHTQREEKEHSKEIGGELWNSFQKNETFTSQNIEFTSFFSLFVNRQILQYKWNSNDILLMKEKKESSGIKTKNQLKLKTSLSFY